MCAGCLVCLVPFRVFSSILAQWTPVATPPLPSCNNQKLLQILANVSCGIKSLLVENHCFNFYTILFSLPRDQEKASLKVLVKIHSRRKTRTIAIVTKQCGLNYVSQRNMFKS